MIHKQTMGYKTAFFISTFLFLPLATFAGQVQDTYPWDKFLHAVSTDMSSNIALAIGIIAIAGCGLTMAFVDLQGGGKLAVRVGIGLSIAFTAGSIVTKLFGGGAIIF